MSKVRLDKLYTLYDASEIKDIWDAAQTVPCIKDPKEGLISPYKYRTNKSFKPCPYCGKKMVHGRQYSTQSKEEAKKRGYEYKTVDGKLYINQAGSFYYHEHYVTIDHKLNKARFPEKMFDYDNLEAICWRCNNEKSDNLIFELEHKLEHLKSLKESVFNRYPNANS
ncbi:MAG: HNH endonuclease [Okeania sp. SIO3B5]|uniref:HNH endonuclease n=1 Tax=Okeania sp. SIO3B5 TaxID=2607811 RepID=UPI0013FED886|nr:HNH endonuclease [Okeania sp. SIO3B5]NEO54469.1 HNH endonuclease [Okeania sp. SIO3B5]